MHADSKLLSKALKNLLSNAIKYSPKTSRIWFSANCTETEIYFSVRDHGIGIPPAEQQFLFDLFHRGSNVGTIQGTGLGLTIVRQAVEAHQGDILIESDPGRGSTFTLKIPLTA
jgi:signal transduction histidine kinase